MRKYSKEQIREIAADVFGRYPKAMNVAVTEDGQAFITDESDAAARNHAREKRYKQPLRISSFRREDLEEKPKEKNDSGRKEKEDKGSKKAKEGGKQTTENAATGQPEPTHESGQVESKESSKTEES